METKNKMEKRIKRMIPPSEIRASIPENSVNEETRTAELVWSTGSKGLRRGWDGDYYESLSMSPEHVDMSRLQNGAPLLAAHDSYSLDSVIGVIERASVDGKQGVATVRFAKDEVSERIFQKVKDGILRNVSVGYSVQEYRDISERDDKVPTFEATRWTPMEISIVPIGFDAKAQVRNQTVTESEVEIISRSDEQPIKEQVMPPENTQPQIDTEALKREAAEMERKRSSEIRHAVRTAKLDEAFADQLIERGVSADEARKSVLEKLAEQSAAQPKVDPTVRMETVSDEKDKKREAAVSALLYRLDPQNFQIEQGNPFHGMSMLRMMESFSPRRSGMTDAMLARNAMSSSDLPYILANVAEKGAQKKYDLQPRTWSRWASTGTLRNYKTHDQVRSGDFSSLLERKEDGEFKRGSFGEEREQVTLKDWGIILPFTRVMLINDDLGEIAKVIAQSGVAASRLENRLVYEQLTGSVTMGDGVALFHADHGNLAANSDAAALSDTTIGTAFRAMREQTSVDGLDYLNLAPKYLICGPQTEVIARKYLAQITPAQASNVNVFSGSLELIVDAQISTNDYFFAADQNLIDTVKLFHLEGEEKPRVETRINFETESVEVKCAHAAVAKAMDWRGLYKNPNAN
jgi:hypothetical protein